MDMVIRIVPVYGFLPILQDQDGKVLYRGEFFESSHEALNKLLDVTIERLKVDNEGALV